MSEYITKEGFIDTVEGKSYKKGAKFIVGAKTDKKRLEALLSTNNGQGRAMIEEVKKEIVKKGK